MKYPLVILEGPDACGKSTLAEFLRSNARFPVELIHGERNGDDPARENNDVIMREYHLQVLERARELIQSRVSVILDRHWVSHMAYGGCLSPEKYGALRFIREIRDLEGRYIACLDPAGEANHRANRDPDHPYDDAKYRKVLDTYQKLMSPRLLVRGTENCLLHYRFSQQLGAMGRLQWVRHNLPGWTADE